MAWTGGRTPLSQNKRSPCTGSRWPAEAYVSPVPRPSASRPSQSERRSAARCRSLLHPVMKCLRCAADLGRNRCHRRSARRGLAGVIQNHPNGAVPALRRKLVCRLACHGSILSGVGAFRQTRGGSDRYLHQQYYGCDRCNENGLSRQRHGYANRASAQEARKGVEDESRYVRKYASTRTSMSSFQLQPHHHGTISLARVQLKYGKAPENNKLAEEILKPKRTNLVWSGSKNARNAAHLPSRARRVSQVKDKERHQLRIDLVSPLR